MNQLLKFCPTIPDLTQMPGNFCREFCSDQNKDLILQPLPNCDAKSNFGVLMIIWRELRSIHKKTNPTEAEIDNYPNLVRRFLQLLAQKFPWFKPFPNQFHRLTHNFYFMTNDENSLGAKSLEGLEKGNFTTQVMDSHRTYKGSRKKANKGVMKLLRLKSSRLLRHYRRKPPTRLQYCSRCKKSGHNASNKVCLAGFTEQGGGDGAGDQEVAGEGYQGAGEELVGTVETEVPSADMDVVVESDMLQETETQLADIDDLLAQDNSVDSDLLGGDEDSEDDMF